MKVRVDSEMCQAHGRCCIMDAELFDLDDEGYPTIRGDDFVAVPDGHEDGARRAVESCPERAIELQD